MTPWSPLPKLSMRRSPPHRILTAHQLLDGYQAATADLE
jgi:hypothetical protein